MEQLFFYGEIIVLIPVIILELSPLSYTKKEKKIILTGVIFLTLREAICTII